MESKDINETGNNEGFYGSVNKWESDFRKRIHFVKIDNNLLLSRHIDGVEKLWPVAIGSVPTMESAYLLRECFQYAMDEGVIEEREGKLDLKVINGFGL